MDKAVVNNWAVKLKLIALAEVCSLELSPFNDFWYSIISESCFNIIFLLLEVIVADKLLLIFFASVLLPHISSPSSLFFFRPNLRFSPLRRHRKSKAVIKMPSERRRNRSCTITIRSARSSSALLTGGAFSVMVLFVLFRYFQNWFYIYYFLTSRIF